MSRTYVISEIGINHNGDLGLARELIKASAEAGADAVKFQKRTIELVYSEKDLNKYQKVPHEIIIATAIIESDYGTKR